MRAYTRLPDICQQESPDLGIHILEQKLKPFSGDSKTIPGTCTTGSALQNTEIIRHIYIQHTIILPPLLHPPFSSSSSLLFFILPSLLHPHLLLHLFLIPYSSFSFSVVITVQFFYHKTWASFCPGSVYKSTCSA